MTDKEILDGILQKLGIGELAEYQVKYDEHGISLNWICPMKK